MNKTGTVLPKPNSNKFSLEKMQTAYINNLEEIIRVLSEVVISLCSDDCVESSSISELNSLHSQLKYQQKMRNESQGRHHQLNRVVQEVVYSLKSKNQEFPKIRQMKSQHGGDLSTIAEKYSEENLLANYLRKNSNQTNKNHQSKNLSYLQRYSETINPSGVIREDTRRSLQPHPIHKKSLYNDLERIKPKQHTNSPKNHGETNKKFQIKNKLPYYNISKLI